MILLEIDPEGIARIEFESDAPRAVDMNRITGRDKSLQRMKVKPGKIHLFWRSRGVEPIKPDQDTFVHLGVNLRSAAFRPQVGERLASECPDHRIM